MPAPQPAPTGAPTTGFNAEHAHGILRGFMDAGAELVQNLVAQVRRDPDPHPFWGDKAPVEHPTEHIARCYDRITRSVRRSIALARHLDEPLRARPTPGPAQPQRPAAAPANDAEPEARDTPERPDEPDWNEPDWNEPGWNEPHWTEPGWTEDHHQDLARPLADVLAELANDLGLAPNAPNGPPEPGPAPGTAHGRQTASPQAHPAPANPAPEPAPPSPITHRPPRKPPG